MVIGIIAGMGAFILSVWAGIKFVASFVKDVAKVVFEFFKTIIIWIIIPAPKPVKFIIFIFLILLVGNVASSFMLGMKYTCNGEELREYTNLGIGISSTFIDMIRDDNINESRVCTATGNIQPWTSYPEELRFTYNPNDISFSSDCDNYCTKGGIIIKEIVCKEACVNITNNDGELFKSCPTGLFNINEIVLNNTIPVDDFSETSNDIFQISCSSSSNPRFTLFFIDVLSWELWTILTLLYFIYLVKKH